jgi:glutamate dehydrogenase
VPTSLAERVAHLEALVPSLDIVEIAEAEGLDVVSVADVYFSLGAKLELQWLRDRIVALSRETRWAAMARAALRDDVYSEQAALTAEVLNAGARSAAAPQRVETWLDDNKGAVERTLQLLADIRTGGTLDLARLNVAVREIRNLIHSSGSPEPPPQAPAPAAEPAAAETA